jgi:hypothetical protein
MICISKQFLQVYYKLVKGPIHKSSTSNHGYEGSKLTTDKSSPTIKQFSGKKKRKMVVNDLL